MVRSKQILVSAFSFTINIIIYPCHRFAIQTKDKEGRFDSTKFSDACVCRNFGLPRTTVTFCYGARQFPHRNLYSVTYNLTEGSIDLVPLLILHIEIFMYRLLHRTFWRVCIGDGIHTRYSTSYSIGYSTW